MFICLVFRVVFLVRSVLFICLVFCVVFLVGSVLFICLICCVVFLVGSVAKNAVAFLDPFGNVALCFADTFGVSPVQTAFMNVTQSYAKIRYELMNGISGDRQ